MLKYLTIISILTKYKTKFIKAIFNSFFMTDKFVLVSLEEKKAKKLAEVISNSTCRKILDYISDKEDASESDIAKALKIPMSTAHYNLENLMKAGLVEVKEFRWSEKGKQIDLFRLAKKFILISPKGTKIEKSKLRDIFAVTIISGLGSLLAGYLAKGIFFAEKSADVMIESVKMLAAPVDEVMPLAAQTVAQNIWGYYALFFFVGALFALLFYTFINWKKR